MDELSRLARFRTEILSGLTVSLALVPEAIAFAFVAGVHLLARIHGKVGAAQVAINGRIADAETFVDGKVSAARDDVNGKVGAAEVAIGERIGVAETFIVGKVTEINDASLVVERALAGEIKPESTEGHRWTA